MNELITSDNSAIIDHLLVVVVVFIAISVAVMVAVQVVKWWFKLEDNKESILDSILSFGDVGVRLDVVFADCFEETSEESFYKITDILREVGHIDHGMTPSAWIVTPTGKTWLKNLKERKKQPDFSNH